MTLRWFLTYREMNEFLVLSIKKDLVDSPSHRSLFYKLDDI